MPKPYDVIVIGAGAAGLIAAGRAAELGGRVLVLEKMERAGRKLLITGKGRCNITNAAPREEFLKHIHPNGRFLNHAFSGFFSQDIINLLDAHGCPTVVERGARVFPASNKSADVVEALMRWLHANHVEIRFAHKVKDLILENDQIMGVEVQSKSGCHIIHATHLIVCTGGKSYPATGSEGDGFRFAASTGHAIETPRQALVPLETAGDDARRLQGLILKNVKAIVWVNGKKAREEFGEMAITAFGLSGPIILTLSRFVVEQLHGHRHQLEVSLDLKPALDDAKLERRLSRDIIDHGKKSMTQFLRMWLPAAMIPVFLDRIGLPGGKLAHQLSVKERRKILLLMKDFRFGITGCRPFKEAIITAGGIRTTDIDPLTMASKHIKNLYFAGEVLDLDADTGGFNLQIAFSTGWLAAQSCMKSHPRTPTLTS